jgi:hypothetical protein
MNRRKTAACILAGAILFALAATIGVPGIPTALRAQNAAVSSSTPPDFSGVYYPFNPGAGGKGGGAPKGAVAAKAAPKGPPARPKQSAPLSDGSQGRAADAPSLTPPYLAKWEMISKSRISGSYEFDFTAQCLPPGMPAMMNMAYGMEVMQTKDKITFFSELNDAMRRVYLDGRKPSPKVLDDPTYAGYSTGHWEGDTLVVDTVALREETFIEGFSPHSDAMTVKERIRFTAPGVLEDRITVTDPKALTKPWETVKTYRKAGPGNDELREFACAEGLAGPK